MVTCSSRSLSASGIGSLSRFLQSTASIRVGKSWTRPVSQRGVHATLKTSDTRCISRLDRVGASIRSTKPLISASLSRISTKSRGRVNGSSKSRGYRGHRFWLMTSKRDTEPSLREFQKNEKRLLEPQFSDAVQLYYRLSHPLQYKPY